MNVGTMGLVFVLMGVGLDVGLMVLHDRCL